MGWNLVVLKKEKHWYLIPWSNFIKFLWCLFPRLNQVDVNISVLQPFNTDDDPSLGSNV